MKLTFSSVLGLVGLLIVQVSADPLRIDPRLARMLVTSDFESGTMSPWFDQSPAKVNWRVEDFYSPAEVNSPAPAPATGTKYLRATRNYNLTSGLAVLQSPMFTALPGDKVRFSFWIRSQQPQGSNLELYWVEGNVEYPLISLFGYSSPANFEWRNVSVTLPFIAPADVSLVFYAFCSRHVEDAVALDNIFIGTPSVDRPSTISPPTTSSTTMTSWTASSTTTRPTTTGPPTAPTTTTESTTTTYDPRTTTPWTTQQPDCSSVLSTTSGSFTSPNYPNNYTNNLSCQWLIFIRIPGARIVLSFTDFQTEQSWDYVTIYDGGSTQAPLLANFSGFIRPADIESSSNILLVTFTTDRSVTRPGFSANYSSIINSYSSTEDPFPTSPDYNDTYTESPTCGDYFASFGGSVVSHYYNINYPDNANCSYYLDSRTVGIYLRFNTFSTESCCDHVTVYEGWNPSGRVLLRASGSSIPDWIHLDSGSRMLLNFMSDGSVTSTGYQADFGGFYPGCDEIITGNNGTLTSTNYPNFYYDYMDCRTVIRVSPGSRIRVNIQDFNLENGWDYLTIYDGQHMDSNQLLRVSGTELPSAITSTSNAILIRFTTDGSVVAQGWRLTYTAV